MARLLNITVRVRGENRPLYRFVKNIDCQLEQCLFGEHLGVYNDLPYAIVESAKTAVLIALFCHALIGVLQTQLDN